MRQTQNPSLSRPLRGSLGAPLGPLVFAFFQLCFFLAQGKGAIPGAALVAAPHSPVRCQMELLRVFAARCGNPRAEQEACVNHPSIFFLSPRM